jgi:gliding motility-associated-like protein
MCQKIIISTLLVLFAASSFGQVAIPTKGKEFWVGFMQNYEVEEWQEELSLFIVSDQSTTGVVEIPGQGWSQAFAVIANQTTTVTIPNNIAEHFSNQIVEQRGIYVETADTVAVFAINFNGFTADGTKILPIQSLGVDYRISAYNGLGQWGSEFLIVASADGSEIEITPAVETAGGQLSGVPFIIELDRGESYQVKVQNDGEDFMGTVINGTAANGDCRPFAVFSGAGCTNIPSTCFACDHIYEQNFPVDTWGTDFYVVPFSFASSYTYRVMANEDNTTIFIEGALEGVLNAGEYYEFNSVEDVQCVSADKGISVTQYMEGVTCTGAGDPAMLILNDESQKIDNITFSTVNSTVITDHGLNVIMNTADVGSLLLDGAVVPAADFIPFGACPGQSYTQIDIAEGSHTMEAANGFTAYVYGTGNAESYAYSVGSFTPSPPLVVDDVLCTSDTVNIAIEGGLLDVYWYAETNPEIVIAEGPQLTLFPPIISDIYVAVGNQFLSGCVEEQFFSVEVPEPPTLILSQSEEEICQFQSVQFDTEVIPNSGAYTYTWTPSIGLDNPNIANPVATPLETTTYSVLVSTATGCGSNVDSLTIEVIPGNISNFEATADDLSICTGEEVQLNLDVQESIFEDNFDPGVSWGLWSNVSLGSEGDGCGSATGNALYFNGAGERSASTIDLNVLTGGSIQFSLLIGSGAFPCDNVDPGEDIELEYSTNGGGNWTSIQTYFESGYAVFTDAEVDIPAGAETASTRFRWRQLANSGNNQDNWAIDNVYIGAINDTFAFEWSPNYELTDINILDPIASPLLDTTYYVTMTDPMTGCIYTDSVSIDVGQGFTLEMTPDSTICDIAGIQIEAIPNIEGEYGYLWTGVGLNNPFIMDPIAAPAVTTTFSVEVTSEQGCSSVGEVTITVNQLLDLVVTVSDDEFCAGETVNLTSNVGGINVGLEFEWSPALGLDDATAQNPSATPLEDVTYTVVVTDTDSGCVLTDQVELEVYDSFTIDAGEDLELCVVEGFQFNVLDDTDDPLQWTWTPALNLDNPGIPNPTILTDLTGEFTVTAESPAGCSSTDIVNITLLFESFDLGPNIDICVGDEVEIETGYGSEIEHDWSTDETTTSITVSEGGIYSVTVTSIDGCLDSDEIEIIMHDLPIVDLGADPGLCEGDIYEIDAQNPGQTYLWSDASVNQTLEVSETGLYSVAVTDGFQCVGEDELQVTFHLNPVINLPETYTMCEDESLVLDAENPGSTFEWSNDEVTQQVTVNLEGLYTVEVTNENNCASSDQTFLTVATYPVVDLGGDVAYCETEIHTLDAGNLGLTFNWNTTEITQTIDVTSSGIYTVTVDNDYCFTSDAVSIVFNPLPIDQLGADTTLCFEQPPYELMVNAGNNGSSYVWSDGSTNQSFGAPGPGVYTVDVTTAFDCSSTFEIILSELCAGTIYIPNSFTPNNDGVNDVFRAVGDNVVDFEMEIWNRWGELVFKSTGIESFWNGSFEQGDYYTESEVYTYVVRYTYLLDFDGTLSNTEEVVGHVTLIR